ncbi:MAG: hypothetical protein BGO92_19665 [Magnetospirillum sp. 64-120]|nr:MAG: hypothetical protein BGO92_19665 [Magnetospirillum sp. 64-120]
MVVDAGDEGACGDALFPGHLIQHRPERPFKADGGGMAMDSDRAFFGQEGPRLLGVAQAEQTRQRPVTKVGDRPRF